MRFQISLLTPFNAISGAAHPELHEELEPLNELRYHEGLSRIANEIPAEDLVVQ